MASINDLATAATIASSAVALQSSPKQEGAQPAQSTPPPHSPIHGVAATPAMAQITTISEPKHSSRPATAEDGDSITVATGHPPPAVLAAPLTSPQNPSQVQIPAPPPPPPATDTAAGNGGVEDKGAAVDIMDGVEKEKELPVRGAFIVFEGMDRAGKTTQAKLLQQRCIESGRDVRFMRFPGTSNNQPP